MPLLVFVAVAGGFGTGAGGLGAQFFVDFGEELINSVGYEGVAAFISCQK